MEKELDCAVARDLLPSYADGLTSSATNRALEEHLAGCPDCAAALRRMKEPAAPPAAPEVDYLKKLRRRSRRASLLIAIALLLAGMAVTGVRVFYVGRAAAATDAACRVTVQGDTVTVEGTLTASGLGVARVTFSESAGVVRCRVYTAPKAFFNRGEFSASYTAGTDITQVRLEELILWEGGTAISSAAARLLAAANPYVGDMPANSRIAQILGIRDQFGSFTNELQTDREPYGWTLRLETPITAAEESAALSLMAADSCVLLAAVGNLGAVEWRYTTEAGEESYRITAAGASALAGREIKDCAASASAMQALLESLNIRWPGVPEPQTTQGFTLVFHNESDTPLSELAIECYLGDALISGGGGMNADGTPLGRDGLSFELLPENFPKDTTAISLSDFAFALYAVTTEGERFAVGERVPLAAKNGWRFTYCITGSAAEGFSLREE